MSHMSEIRAPAAPRTFRDSCFQISPRHAPRLGFVMRVNPPRPPSAKIAPCPFLDLIRSTAPPSVANGMSLAPRLDAARAIEPLVKRPVGNGKNSTLENQQRSQRHGIDLRQARSLVRRTVQSFKPSK